MRKSYLNTQLVLDVLNIYKYAVYMVM